MISFRDSPARGGVLFRASAKRVSPGPTPHVFRGKETTFACQMSLREAERQRPKRSDFVRPMSDFVHSRPILQPQNPDVFGQKATKPDISGKQADFASENVRFSKSGSKKDEAAGRPGKGFRRGFRGGANHHKDTKSRREKRFGRREGISHVRNGGQARPPHKCMGWSWVGRASPHVNARGAPVQSQGNPNARMMKTAIWSRVQTISGW